VIDHNNPIVKLCGQGMEREQEGEHEEARELFLTAWEQSSLPVERAIAAHYVARYQTSVEMILFWNQTAVNNADSVENDSAKELYPSLYLNLGRSHEDTGSMSDAKRCYERAQQCLDDLPEDGYRKLIQNATAAGLDRITRAQNS
jgi:tetratricopeptide (TPR) repeat protein